MIERRVKRKAVSWPGWRSGFLRSLAFLLLATGAHGATTGFVLEIELANPQGGAAQLFYDVGQWYSVRDSARVEIPAGAELKPYRFAIPAKSIKRLRFDPADGAATLRIGRLRLLTSDGAELARFGADRLVPMHAITRLQVADGVATVETAADDPMLLIAQPLQAETARALDKSIVTAPAIIALAVVVFGALVWAVMGAVRVMADGGRGRVFVGSFLVVAGARLWWLKSYSLAMPFWDDWKTGAIDLLMPLRGGFLEWETLFAPHGEHRILVTRLITLVGSLLNREWDPRVAMTIGALFFAAAVGLLAAACAHAGRRGLIVVGGLLACACLPYDMRNIYWGDQSQMYALLLLAVTTLSLAGVSAVTRRVWIVAAAAGAVSLFTMGSGFVAPGIAAAVCVLRATRETEQRRGLLILAAIFGAFALAGMALYRSAPFQGSDYAHSWGQFLSALTGRAAWPLPPQPWWALVTWLPWLLVALGLVRTRRGGALEWLALGVGLWALVNAAGLAHGRPLEAPPFDSKYYTAMSTGVFAALLSVTALIARWSETRARATIAGLATLAVTIALLRFGGAAVQESRDQFNARRAHDDVVRPFLASGDPTQLRATPWHHLPYWNGAELADLLDAPLLQPSLPTPLRAALARRPGSGFPPSPEPGPLTIAARTLMKLGLLFALSGVGLLAWWAWRAPDARTDKAA